MIGGHALATLLQRSWPMRQALKVVARLLVPRQAVGAVGAIVDDQGRVLVLHHIFRTDYPWGLPGGWVKRGEDPREAVRREAQEELGLDIEVGELLGAERVGLVARSTHPPHLGLAYRCRLRRSGTVRLGFEVLAAEWVTPATLSYELAPFQRKALEQAVAPLETNRDNRQPLSVPRGHVS